MCRARFSGDRAKQYCSPAHIGYICTNDLVPVTITLPSSPVVRDVYKVAAVGAGGWIIAQNANQ